MESPALWSRIIVDTDNWPLTDKAVISRNLGLLSTSLTRSGSHPLDVDIIIGSPLQEDWHSASTKTVALLSEHGHRWRTLFLWCATPSYIKIMELARGKLNSLVKLELVVSRISLWHSESAAPTDIFLDCPSLRKVIFCGDSKYIPALPAAQLSSFFVFL
ncbi:hypothetical protein MIND_00409600 [Mycena indigotica]|uniref:Uncharacterized protein n=1 Tax=Mycena indigotica TaxID=2126181 RepID=A0A8H6SUM1_9AGAR|nr:uncharacterized protein MIND_00409600 [Mycena indigotica]KAF7306193.1 hypothetical protein MIND_00409600 [Mycena indigotica]